MMALISKYMQRRKQGEKQQEGKLDIDETALPQRHQKRLTELYTGTGSERSGEASGELHDSGIIRGSISRCIKYSR